MSKSVRRSNYPIISLREAVQRVEKIHDQEYTHLTTREVVAKTLGYGGINGASDGIISELSKYGLLESVDKIDYRVSDGSLNIIFHFRGVPSRRHIVE